jgi:hypothetical protein
MRAHREKLHFERGHDYGTRHGDTPISVWRLMNPFKFRRGPVDLRQLPKVGPMPWMRSLQPTPNERAGWEREPSCFHHLPQGCVLETGKDVSFVVKTELSRTVKLVPFSIGSYILSSSHSLLLPRPGPSSSWNDASHEAPWPRRPRDGPLSSTVGRPRVWSVSAPRLHSCASTS